MRKMQRFDKILTKKDGSGGGKRGTIRVTLQLVKISEDLTINIPRFEGMGNVDLFPHTASVLLKLFTYMFKEGFFTKEDGLFRKAGRLDDISFHHQKMMYGRPLYFNEIEDPHTLAGLIKCLLRDLKEPVFTFSTYFELLEIPKLIVLEEKLERIRIIMNEKIPRENQEILCILFMFLHQVAKRSQKNKMTEENLAIVLSPNILYCDDTLTSLKSMSEAHMVVKFFIEHAEIIFRTRGASGGALIPYFDLFDGIDDDGLMNAEQVERMKTRGHKLRLLIKEMKRKAIEEEEEGKKLRVVVLSWDKKEEPVIMNPSEVQQQQQQPTEVIIEEEGEEEEEEEEVFPKKEEPEERDMQEKEQELVIPELIIPEEKEPPKQKEMELVVPEQMELFVPKQMELVVPAQQYHQQQQQQEEEEEESSEESDAGEALDGIGGDGQFILSIPKVRKRKGSSGLTTSMRREGIVNWEMKWSELKKEHDILQKKYNENKTREQLKFGGSGEMMKKAFFQNSDVLNLKMEELKEIKQLLEDSLKLVNLEIDKKLMEDF